ncbi:cysteine desulfurase family protein [Telmatospirillum sp.]|uniref:cysteine desulfurase family protein n=1 Tax=Telmatospirillum sp. TaxID=2079197 RepID=UPI00283C2DA2|nr:cysteine desulfurase family protein [Telmatospirillum sp.]MDR3439973.1 cysteine desulfurase family protein [Telmatospirillum sp.]
MRTAYFDNNATTQALPRVVEAMMTRFTDGFGNPSSAYRRGREARAAVETARASVARLFGCAPSEVIFTSGGTEGDNNAILGLCEDGDHVITSAIEHDAILNSCRALEHRGGMVTLLRTDSSGRVDPEAVRKALRPNTKLISLMMANNETGVLQPVEEIGKIAAEADVWFHTDAVQAAGKAPISVERIGCDLLSISAHKFHGPQGVGALYVRRGTPLKPIMHGGHQERGRRAGTENLPGIVGLGLAADTAIAGLEDGTVEQIRLWRDRFETEITKAIDGVEINGKTAPRVGNTTSLFLDGLLAETVLVALDNLGISVSAGSACSAGSRKPSHVLMAMGLGAQRARSTLRVSLGKLNSEDDIDYLLSVLPDTVRQLRKASPVYQRGLEKGRQTTQP